MRVTRINQRPNDNKDLLKRASRPRRRKRYVDESEIQKVTDVTNSLNAVGSFTYADYNRNKGGIGYFKHHVDQVISNYGIDLVYFRKYNTFFKEGEENTANLIYGEDTTASYYASGMIRAYVSVENMAWNFNQIGLEGTEQVNMFISIENFEQAFADQIGKLKTSYFEVPVSGNTINNEITGKIDTPEFAGEVYSEFDDSLVVKNAKVRMVNKSANNTFYLTKDYDTSKYRISGSLSGKLKHDDEKPFIVWRMACW